jgi:hypothetical protein
MLPVQLASVNARSQFSIMNAVTVNLLLIHANTTSFIFMNAIKAKLLLMKVAMTRFLAPEKSACHKN